MGRLRIYSEWETYVERYLFSKSLVLFLKEGELMSDNPSPASAQDGLSVRGFSADGAVLLAFDLDQQRTPNLAGFAIQCTPPNGKPYYLPNRLNFNIPMTGQTAPENRV